VKVDLTHPEKNVALLEIQVGPDQVVQARQSVYRKMVGRYSIPGFRRGKAPLAILERHVGSDFFDQEVLEHLIGEVYPQAMEEQALEPVGPPEFDLKDWQPRESLVLAAKVTVKPEVKLGQYTGHEIPKGQVDITDAAVDQELESIRRAFAQLVEADPELEVSEGSVAVIDFVGYLDGQPFEGGSSEGYPLELGSGAFVPGFEDGLVGAKVGDERDVAVTFPEDYAEHLAGKEVTFKVTVKGHRRRQLPDLDDQLAEKAAPMMGLKSGEEDEPLTLEKLRDAIRLRLGATAERRVREDYEERVIAKVTELAEIDVPHVMVDRATNVRLQEYEEMFQRSGSSLQQYLSESNITGPDLRERLGPAALETVRRELVLDQVAKEEAIAATDQEVDERIATFAQIRNEDPAEVRTRVIADDGFERIRDEIVRRKTIDYLVGAQIEVAASPDDDAQTDDSSVQDSEIGDHTPPVADQESEDAGEAPKEPTGSGR